MSPAAALAGTRQKVDNVNRAFAMFEGIEAAASKEIERLERWRSRYARQRERLADYVLALMTASKLTVLEGEISGFRAQQNPPAVVIDDAAAVPPEFLKYAAPPPPTPNKDEIKRAIRSGREVAGCRLVAATRLVRS